MVVGLVTVGLRASYVRGFHLRDAVRFLLRREIPIQVPFAVRVLSDVVEDVAEAADPGRAVTEGWEVFWNDRGSSAMSSYVLYLRCDEGRRCVS